MKKSLLTILLLGSIISQISATVYRVNSVTNYNSALSNVRSGDTISWHPGTYSGINIRLTKDNIVFMAKVAGEVIFNGDSKLLVTGNGNTIEGFQYLGGRIESGNVLESRGSDNHFTNINIKDYFCTKYVVVSPTAKRIKFTYCTFENRTSILNKNILSLTYDGKTPGYHLISHCQFKNFRGAGNGADYGVEPIRLGVGGDQGHYISRSIVEYCYFSQCNGDGEIISSKSTENIYRYNTFENNPYGTLVLRHGSNGIVYGNFFDKCQGGVRVKEGHNHLIYNNYFSNLSSNSIYIQNYEIDTPDSILIAHNTIVEAGPVRLGNSGSYKPTNVVIANNIFKSKSKDLFENATGDETWVSNIVDGETGISNTEGFIEIDPRLVSNSQGFYELAASSPAIDNSKPFDFNIYEFEGLQADYDIELDVLKNARPTDVLKKDIGAQEYKADAVVQPHVTLDNTGAKYLQPETPAATSPEMKAQHQVAIYPNPTKHSFTIQSEGEDISNVSIYAISGTLVYQSSLQTRRLTINEQLNSGIYVVRIKHTDATVETQRLIVK